MPTDASNELPVHVANYRAQARELIPRWYNGWWHLSFNIAISLAIIITALTHLSAVSEGEWLTIPITFIYSNLAEYVGHRGPMHHRYPLLNALFTGHATTHHRFYTHDAMGSDQNRDFVRVLAGFSFILFFLGAFGFPLALLLRFVFSPNVSWLFVATSIGYFLNYELLHWAYHLPDRHWIVRLPGMPYLRLLHQVHHNPRHMQKANFNITYPIFDLIFRTYLT